MRDQSISHAHSEHASTQDAIQQRTHKPYRVREVAAALDVHQSTIYRDIESGKLRALRIGTGRGALRVPHWAFQEYLAQLENDAVVIPAEGVA